MVSKLSYRLRSVCESVAAQWIKAPAVESLRRFRVALALFTVAYLLLLIPNWELYFGPDGVTGSVRAPLLSYRFPNSLLHYLENSTQLWSFWGLSMIAAIGLALGKWTRIACAWLWFVFLSLNMGSKVANGEEQILTILFFYASFLPFAKHSGANVNAKNELRSIGGVWAWRMLQINVAAVYVFGGWWKLWVDPAWRDGTALHYALLSIEYPRWPGILLELAPFDVVISRVLSYWTIVVEIVAPFFLVSHRWRSAALFAMLSLHIGIGVLLEGVTLFNASMCVALLVFVEPRRINAHNENQARALSRILAQS